MNKEYKIKNSNNYDNSAVKLMFLATLVYIISYFGRKSYDSNINEIMSFYGVNKSSAGLVGTFFFIVYACGQVFHGIMCKYYNPKYAISGALVMASLCNLAMGVMPVEWFHYLKFVWLLNGFSMATLWSTIVRTFNKNFSKKRLKQALVFMAFPVSIGTFFIYGASALFSLLNRFKYTFYLASLMLVVIAIVWFLFIDKLIYKSKLEKNAVDGATEEQFERKVKQEKVKIDRGFYVLFGILAFFAIINNFVKDGLNTWTPTIFTDKYNLENWFAVLLTILLPLFAILGANLAITLSRKVKNYVVGCGVLYSTATLILGILLILLNFNSWVVSLICFMLISAMMAGVNNIITNVFPMQLKNGVDAGLIAGFIDGFCYVGSALSSFGLGSIAEHADWNVIMYLFLGLCVFCVLTVAVFVLIQKIKSKKNA